MVKWRDLIAAEERLEAAEAEYRKYNGDPEQWAAFESVDPQGRRSLNVSKFHFEKRDALLAQIEHERRAVLAMRKRFVEET